MPQIYTQLAMRCVEIEKQIAFDNNILAFDPLGRNGLLSNNALREIS